MHNRFSALELALAYARDKQLEADDVLVVAGKFYEFVIGASTDGIAYSESDQASLPTADAVPASPAPTATPQPATSVQAPVEQPPAPPPPPPTPAVTEPPAPVVDPVQPVA